MSSQIGRPKVDNPKDIRFSVRLDAETEKKLINYCNEYKISKGEAIRQGIYLLLEEKNNGTSTLRKSISTTILRPTTKGLINIVYHTSCGISNTLEDKNMNKLEVININNSNVSVKEFKGQRVVTFKDIDTVHQRPDGTAKRNFNENKSKFIENEDYFIIKPADILRYEIRTLETSNRGITVLTESGYLMLVKSFTNELVWRVQRQLVNTYFKIRQQQSQPKVPFTEVVQSIDIVANSLKVNDASKLLMYDKLYSSYGVSTDFLPKYENNNSREIRPATKLLKRINSNIKTAVFNKLLIKNGYLEERTRKSTKSDELRYFKALTKKGLQYGENLINQKNQREVQPYYYADTFQELYDLVTAKETVLV